MEKTKTQEGMITERTEEMTEHHLRNREMRSVEKIKTDFVLIRPVAGHH
ncbi:hypothetical protein [Salinivibrio costicola]|nr:hypothetical protein [Salinivibrio costicola]